jgi:glycosyltransferase involved in cell wall biosynthesis
MNVVAILPALDEEATVGEVVRGLEPHVRAVVVVDNGSCDATSARAQAAGARVLREPRHGYGAACLAGARAAAYLGAEVLLFLDADGSDDPADAPLLLGPIAAGDADLVLGTRPAELVEPGAMGPAQRFGNWLAPLLMRAVVGAPYHDMPPYKAITRTAFDELALTDQTYGFTIEMLLKAHARALRVREVSVRCWARRGGASKVSGTLRGTAAAAMKILVSIARYSETGIRRNRIVTCRELDTGGTS